MCHRAQATSAGERVSAENGPGTASVGPPTARTTTQEGGRVSFGDKMENKAEELKGEAKERYGDATDNESLQAEGAAEQTDAKFSQAGEHVKDAARKVGDAFKG